MSLLEEKLHMQIRTTVPCATRGLIEALQKRQLRYTEARAIYRIFYFDMDESQWGVFGDGENGAYEWFIWRRAGLQTSDCGYGNPDAAMRDALNGPLGDGEVAA